MRTVKEGQTIQLIQSRLNGNSDVLSFLTEPEHQCLPASKTLFGLAPSTAPENNQFIFWNTFWTTIVIGFDCTCMLASRSFIWSRVDDRVETASISESLAFFHFSLKVSNSCGMLSISSQILLLMISPPASSPPSPSSPASSTLSEAS